MRLRNQLVIAAENFVTVENLTSMLIPTISKELDEQLKVAQKVVDFVDHPYKKFCVTLLRYNTDKPGRLYAQVQIFSRKSKMGHFNKLPMSIKNFKFLSIYLMFLVLFMKK